MIGTAVTPDDLISPAYREEQRILHLAPRGYGGKGDKWSTAVAALAWTRGCTSILDYGCGQGRLLGAYIAIRVRDLRNYDPAIPERSALPEPADLVTCTDVLEHIEPEKLPTVLAHLRSLARKAVFVVIATRPSGKVLSDGRNAHLILEDDAWWTQTLEQACFRVGPGPVSPSRKPSREFIAVLEP